MKIGIDISQTAFSGTGVGNFVKNLVENLSKIDSQNEYVLFYSSLRKEFPMSNFQFPKNFQVKKFKIPIKVLEIVWNRSHIFPIEWFIGPVDVFLTSDWLEPPTMRAKKATIIYDLISHLYPEETDKKIISNQKKKNSWAKKETSVFITISESSKKDLIQNLGISEEKIKVVYPGG